MSSPPNGLDILKWGKTISENHTEKYSTNNQNKMSPNNWPEATDQLLF